MEKQLIVYALLKLSVSSNGSNGLRHRPPHSSARPTQCLSVSSNGSNGLRHLATQVNLHHLPGLSVSSNGSNGLRLDTDTRWVLHKEPFSILERIEWAATLPGINLILWPPAGFQYPRTDRMGCDTAVAVIVTVTVETFSILERIEWAATPPASGVPDAHLLLSVSSNGSNGLRHYG